ncbi:acyl carrier protein [Streptomyces sp. V2]|uniref:Acyl carrier protein n=1 Tax=Streptomyces niveiscabiei TaxID=164115 RepID=A0ABW9I469_9ACTN|nr:MULTISPECIES: acyl carrier protein [Streptomyces]PWG10657.1 acyl carrier protein [Streptomyces sp. V2]QZZ31523.1 acyl carrier protein [Streptomyces sp. ST1015]
MTTEAGPSHAEAARQIAGIFREVLGARTDPETGSEFLAIGGDSLTAARAVSLISTRFGVRVTVRDLFRSKTADALAAVVRARTAG